MVAIVCANCSVLPLWREKFILFQPVINRDKFATPKFCRHPSPPVASSGRNFDLKAVRKNRGEFGGDLRMARIGRQFGCPPGQRVAFEGNPSLDPSAASPLQN